jgi:hypothetical protein
VMTLGCGSSGADVENDSASPPSMPVASGGRAATPPAVNTGGAPAAPSASPSAEDLAALGDALGMAGEQLQSACGVPLERCSSTPGCNEILACAASSACTGRECYCSGDGCATDGPCRAVIEAAPGARLPDAANPSLGPAPDAASAVGVCVEGLAGGGSSLPGFGPNPSSPADPGASDAG